MPDSAALDVFQYLDYRAFLRAFYEHRKQHQYGFSFRSFSRTARLRSPNYLKLVMDGERKLTAPMARRFADACGLAHESADYFCDLVAYNQAASHRDRERCYARLQRYQRYHEVHRLARAQARYHSRWYHVAIRELVRHAAFRPDPAWIAATLVPRIQPKEAAQAVETLIALGLLTRDPRGRLRQTDPLVTTGGGPLSHEVVRFHREMMKRASESLDAIPREARQISSLTLALDEQSFELVKERIKSLRRELLQLETEVTRPTRVAQVNFQLFPLSSDGEPNDA